MDELLKTLITQAPNFVGFIILSFVLVKFVIQPGIDLISKQNETIKQLAFKLAECNDETVRQEETD